MKTLSNAQLMKEVRKLRASLDPIINLQFKELLIEVERRLNGGETVQPGAMKRTNPQKKKGLTKKEIYLKYLYK